MKIGIQTWGSEGDINPFIALAGGLAEVGHQVTLAVTSAERKDYSHFGERLGFKVISAGYIGKDEAELYNMGQQLFESSPWKQVKIIFEDMLAPGVDSIYHMASTLCAESDLLIGHFILYPLQTAAEKFAKPSMTVTLNQSGIPTRYTPPPMLPHFHGWLNILAWKLVEKTLNHVMLPLVNRLRCREGLPPTTSFRKILESPLCNLIAVSPEFCPPRPDWGEHQKVCGFFRLPDSARPWQMPESLVQFLNEGTPPIYMTFGSMLGVEKNLEYLTNTTKLLVDSARLVGCRAIIQSRWQSVTGIPEHKDIYRVTEVPHTQIFHRCVAVVHHGGAGTTQTATLCGCPSVVVAHIADQFFWGNQLQHFKLAPHLLHRRSVTAKKMAREIRRVIDTPAMRENAKRLSRLLNQEEGVQNAVKMIESAVGWTPNSKGFAFRPR